MRRTLDFIGENGFAVRFPKPGVASSTLAGGIKIGPISAFLGEVGPLPYPQNPQKSQSICQFCRSFAAVLPLHDNKPREHSQSKSLSRLKWRGRDFYLYAVNSIGYMGFNRLTFRRGIGQ